MGLFDCKACASKDREILWLRAEMEKLLRVVAEFKEPGVTRRIEPPKPKPADAVPEKRHIAQPTMPGYEPYRGPEIEVR